MSETVLLLLEALEADGVVCLYNENHDERGRFASKDGGATPNASQRVKSDVSKALAAARAAGKGARVGWGDLDAALGRPATSRERTMYRSIIRANGGSIVEAAPAEPPAPEPEGPPAEPPAAPSEPAQDPPAEPAAPEPAAAPEEPAVGDVMAPTSLPVPVVPPDPSRSTGPAGRLVRDLDAREADIFASVRADHLDAREALREGLKARLRELGESKVGYSLADVDFAIQRFEENGGVFVRMDDRARLVRLEDDLLKGAGAAGLHDAKVKASTNGVVDPKTGMLTQRAVPQFRIGALEFPIHTASQTTPTPIETILSVGTKWRMENATSSPAIVWENAVPTTRDIAIPSRRWTTASIDAAIPKAAPPAESIEHTANTVIPIKDIPIAWDPHALAGPLAVQQLSEFEQGRDERTILGRIGARRLAGHDNPAEAALAAEMADRLVEHARIYTNYRPQELERHAVSPKGNPEVGGDLMLPANDRVYVAASGIDGSGRRIGELRSVNAEWKIRGDVTLLRSMGFTRQADEIAKLFGDAATAWSDRVGEIREAAAEIRKNYGNSFWSADPKEYRSRLYHELADRSGYANRFGQVRDEARAILETLPAPRWSPPDDRAVNQITRFAVNYPESQASDYERAAARDRLLALQKSDQAGSLRRAAEALANTPDQAHTSNRIKAVRDFDAARAAEPRPDSSYYVPAGIEELGPRGVKEDGDLSRARTALAAGSRVSERGIELPLAALDKWAKTASSKVGHSTADHAVMDLPDGTPYALPISALRRTLETVRRLPDAQAYIDRDKHGMPLLTFRWRNATQPKGTLSGRLQLFPRIEEGARGSNPRVASVRVGGGSETLTDAQAALLLYNENHDEKGRFAPKDGAGGGSGDGKPKHDLERATKAGRAVAKGATVGREDLERAMGRPPTTREWNMFRSVAKAHGATVVEPPPAPAPPPPPPPEPTPGPISSPVEAPAPPEAPSPPAKPEKPPVGDVTGENVVARGETPTGTFWQEGPELRVTGGDVDHDLAAKARATAASIARAADQLEARLGAIPSPEDTEVLRGLRQNVADYQARADKWEASARVDDARIAEERVAASKDRIRSAAGIHPFLGKSPTGGPLGRDPEPEPKPKKTKADIEAWANGPSLRARAARVVADEAREEAEKIAREYDEVTDAAMRGPGLTQHTQERAAQLRAKMARYKEKADRLDAKAKALEPEPAVSPEVEAFKGWARTHHNTAEERADRLHERAAKAQAEAQGRMDAYRRIADNIPMGQPILIGHHSEKRHRKDIERMHTNLKKGFEASDKAKSLERRARAVEENRVISSDDPDALPKLRERLVEAQGDADAVAAGIRALKRLPKEKWGDPEATKGIPPSVTSFARVMGFAPNATNARAEVRRIAKRIEELEQRQAAPTKTAQHGDITVREDGNRTQLVFPGKPSEEVRKELKSYGFRWSPREGVWQRHRSAGAWYYAEQIAKKAGGGSSALSAEDAVAMARDLDARLDCLAILADDKAPKRPGSCYPAGVMSHDYWKHAAAQAERAEVALEKLKGSPRQGEAVQAFVAASSRLGQAIKLGRWTTARMLLDRRTADLERLVRESDPSMMLADGHGQILIELNADRLACAVELDATVPSADEPKWVQLAYSGTWKGHKQAKSFTFDAKSFEDMVRNFRSDPRYDGGNSDVVAFDFNHASEMHPSQVADKGTPAQAWLQEVEVRTLSGKPELWGKVRYLPLARTYVKGGQYRFLSIAFAPNDRDLETGKPCGPRIKSVAFTNDPFLRGLRPLVASAGASIHLSRDRHEDKMLLEGLIAVLGLSSAATEDEVLGAVETLKTNLDGRDKADAEADVARVCSAYGFEPGRDGPVLLAARQADPDGFAKRYPPKAPAAGGSARGKLAPVVALTSSITAPRKPAAPVSLFSAEAHGGARDEDEDEGGFSLPDGFQLSAYPGRNATERCMAFVDTLPQFKNASHEDRFAAAVAVKRSAMQRGA